MMKHGNAAREYSRCFSGLASHTGQLFALIVLVFLVTSGQVGARETPATGDEQGSGAYQATFEEDATLPAQVVYRPNVLEALKGEKLGVYIFGNGASSADGTNARNHLLEIASQGYVGIASDVDSARHDVRLTLERKNIK
jgi:hypothetical protein